jgi:hypothetical protein
MRYGARVLTSTVPGGEATVSLPSQATAQVQYPQMSRAEATRLLPREGQEVKPETLRQFQQLIAMKRATPPGQRCRRHPAHRDHKLATVITRADVPSMFRQRKFVFRECSVNNCHAIHGRERPFCATALSAASAMVVFSIT